MTNEEEGRISSGRALKIESMTIMKDPHTKPCLKAQGTHGWMLGLGREGAANFCMSSKVF